MKLGFTLILVFFTTIFVFSQPLCQDRHQHQQKIKTQFKSGNESLRSDTINVLDYRVYLDFTQAGSGTLKGNCEVKFSPLMDVTNLSLDLLQLNVDSVVMHGATVPFSYNDTLLIAHFSTINLGAIDSLTVYYQGAPQMDPSGWGGFYMTGGYYYNLGVGFQSLPHNFGRVWHPCFDNFVERAKYQFTILTNAGNTAYCNGTRQSVATVGTDSLLTIWKLNTEIPSYLAGVAVSNYTHVNQVYNSTLQGSTIPVWLAAKAADTTNLKNSFVNLLGALAGFENFYGPYNWERVGYVMVPFNSGAMEHATNIAYPLATINGSTTYETLMAHELSHHWWGDWVTCETAEEMWINEGMAAYSERLFLEWIYGYENYLSEMRSNHHNVLHNAHIKDNGYYALNAVPVAYTYGDHSYNKGSDMMHSLRGYMGDANFFLGLQNIQNNFGGGTISSFEFMQELNTLAGVDVTNFFNDWIFQPGFAHFSVSQFTTSATSGNYAIEVVVDQKLKGGANLYTNVPLQITFMDANWNIHTEQILMSGDYQVFNFSIPINPIFVGLNLDEKINDAITAQHLAVSNTSILVWNYANIQINANSVVDSAFVRVEHNWVYPDVVGVPENIQISMERYWNVHGVDLENITGTMRFEYNAKPIPSGNYDNNLLVDLGNQSFIEDSLVLLYRPNSQANWQIHPNYTQNYLGSHTDKFGYLTANTFAAGQYAFGYRTNSVGLAESKRTPSSFTIYPNPASDSMTIDLSTWSDTQYNALIYGIEGKLANQNTIQGGQTNLIEVSDLENGTYIVIIQNHEGKSLGSKRIVLQGN